MLNIMHIYLFNSVLHPHLLMVYINRIKIKKNKKKNLNMKNNGSLKEI